MRDWNGLERGDVKNYNVLWSEVEIAYLENILEGKSPREAFSIVNKTLLLYLDSPDATRRSVRERLYRLSMIKEPVTITLTDAVGNFVGEQILYPLRNEKP